MVVLPDPFRGMGEHEEFRGDPTVGPHPKVWTRDQKWNKSAKDGTLEVQMRDNLEGGELHPADDGHRRCKKNYPSVLSCIGKRTKEVCDRGSEVGTVYSGRDTEGPVPLRNLAEEDCKILSPGSI